MPNLTQQQEIIKLATERPEIIYPHHYQALEANEKHICFYCLVLDGEENFAIGVHQRQVTVLKLNETVEHDIEKLRGFSDLTDELAISAFQSLYPQRTWAEADRPTCRKHLSKCEWCSGPYLKPVEQDGVDNVQYPDYEDNWRWRNAMTWNWSDRICFGCSDEAYTCTRCSGLTHEDDARYIDEYYWCGDCASDLRYWWCEDCDTNHRSDCPNGNDSPYNVGGIHDYGYKPDARFNIALGEPSTAENPRTVFMGFELEIESGITYVSSIVDTLNDHFGDQEDYVYYKRDGSLNDGVEIVSHPSTLAFHKTKGLGVILAELARIGARSWKTGTCGFHIHIARRAFDNPSHIWKFTHFIVDNKPSMVKLAGRDSERWASFSGFDEFKGILRRAKGERGYNRYEALNFQNRNTIELRFFRGSLEPRRIFSGLELTEAVCQYTRNLSVSDIKNGGLDFSSFVSWVSLSPEKYPNLLSLVKHYGLESNERAVKSGNISREQWEANRSYF